MSPAFCAICRPGAPCLEQPLIARGIEDAGQQALAGRVLQEPASELAQEAMVEAGIDEVERQQVLLYLTASCA